MRVAGVEGGGGGSPLRTATRARPRLDQRKLGGGAASPLHGSAAGPPRPPHSPRPRPLARRPPSLPLTPGPCPNVYMPVKPPATPNLSEPQLPEGEAIRPANWTGPSDLRPLDSDLHPLCRLSHHLGRIRLWCFEEGVWCRERNPGDFWLPPFFWPSGLQTQGTRSWLS